MSSLKLPVKIIGYTKVISSYDLDVDEITFILTPVCSLIHKVCDDSFTYVRPDLLDAGALHINENVR